jgi:hypothetical protein
MNDTTVIIKTIGRPTVHNAVKSSLREGFQTYVISDGVGGIRQTAAHQNIMLGRQWGFYGGMAANVGAAIAPTEYITFLDDDDEFAPGAGDFIRNKLKEDSEVDIWIAGIRMPGEVEIFDTGLGWQKQVTDDPRIWAPVRTEGTGKVLHAGVELGMKPELGPIPGNVCMPTYRTSIFGKVPFKDVIPEGQAPMTDYWHVAHCLQQGYKLDWFGKVLYLVRPQVGGYNGEGL